ncbi:hypothetical protein NDU88_009733 [Pleurodeles waltl]|uniref:Uncharacterized protein n=1 Tax=Pleurodeles waltl TaxID=8319 RepID=A0AAV7QUE4_PLEWA|nr:hypothetical protein NDU88_009733 [Pleurodeles waltl]
MPASASTMVKVSTPGGEAATVKPPLAQGAATTGTGPFLCLMGLGDIHSEHEQFGFHVSMEVKEKIWKGAYEDIFDLLADKSEEEEAKRCKECSYPRGCGHSTHKKKVDTTLQAIMADCFNDLGVQLACYQNRFVGAHDEMVGQSVRIIIRSS